MKGPLYLPASFHGWPRASQLLTCCTRTLHSGQDRSWLQLSLYLCLQQEQLAAQLSCSRAVTQEAIWGAQTIHGMPLCFLRPGLCIFLLQFGGWRRLANASLQAVTSAKPGCKKRCSRDLYRLTVSLAASATFVMYCSRIGLARHAAYHRWQIT